MGSSSYIAKVRTGIGHSLLLIPSVAAVILDAQNQILLQEKSNNTWSLPAGMIEPGETSAEAVCREVKEETGLIVSPQKILGIFGGMQFRHNYPNGDAVEYHITLFKCTLLGDSGYISDSETVSTRLFSKSEMPELALPYPVEVLFDELSEPFFQST